MYGRSGDVRHGTMSAAKKMLIAARIKCICVRLNKVGRQEKRPAFVYK